MSNPTDRSSQGEERYGASRRQMQRAGERDESKKDRRAFAKQVICFLCDTLRKKNRRGLRIGLSHQFKQEFSPRVAFGIESRAESRNHFPKSGNRFSSFQQARHGRTDVGGRVGFSEKRLYPLCLSGVLDPLQGR